MKIDSIHSPIQSAQMGELLTRCFPTPPGGRYWDDFPIWDPGVCDDATLSRWGVSEQGQLIACAGVRLADLHATGAGEVSRGTFLTPVLSVALIGAVATSEQSRGRGLVSELVSHAVQWAQARGEGVNNGLVRNDGASTMNRLRIAIRLVDRGNERCFAWSR